MKTGKITHIDPEGQWNGLQKYKITFADGLQYTFFAKGTFKRNIGDEITYEVSNAEYKNAKLLPDLKQQNSYTGSKDTLIVRQTCVKAAAEFHAQSSNTPEDLLKTAQLMFNWITNE